MSQSGPLELFIYSLPALNLHPKVFTKLHNSSFKNTKFFTFWIPLRHPLCVQAGIWHCNTPHEIITINVKKTDLCPWLGGTCNLWSLGKDLADDTHRWGIIQIFLKNRHPCGWGYQRSLEVPQECVTLQNDRKGCTLDYLDGLGHFLFGLGWQGKHLERVVNTPLGRMRVKTK